ncbi:MAG: hypothetical protein GF411_14660 [Candidatus Lokiarchaeota archaeon]|nr:hypothetical protein [Candidatus Lokiarchaeota archaeon]
MKRLSLSLVVLLMFGLMCSIVVADPPPGLITKRSMTTTRMYDASQEWSDYCSAKSDASDQKVEVECMREDCVNSGATEQDLMVGDGLMVIGDDWFDVAEDDYEFVAAGPYGQGSFYFGEAEQHFNQGEWSEADADYDACNTKLTAFENASIEDGTSAMRSAESSYESAWEEYYWYFMGM